MKVSWTDTFMASVDNSLALQKDSLKGGDPLKAGQYPLEVHHLAHDLRGPLNSILGFSELLLEGVEGPLNEMQQEDIEAIYHSAKNLLLLINNVVDVSKLQAKSLIFDTTVIDLDQVLRAIVHSDFGLAKPSDLTITVPNSIDIPLLHGDATRIEQMILNVIRFGFRVMSSGELKLGATYQEQIVTIKIELGNVEIPDSDQPLLFELGVTIEESGHSQLGLGGLELPLARLLAEHQNGQIQVESDNVRGTVFTIQIPMSENKS